MDPQKHINAPIDIIVSCIARRSQVKRCGLVDLSVIKSADMRDAMRYEAEVLRFSYEMQLHWSARFYALWAMCKKSRKSKLFYLLLTAVNRVFFFKETGHNKHVCASICYINTCMPIPCLCTIIRHKLFHKWTTFLNSKMQLKFLTPERRANF